MYTLIKSSCVLITILAVAVTTICTNNYHRVYTINKGVDVYRYLLEHTDRVRKSPATILSARTGVYAKRQMSKLLK